ncbi:MAG: tRNA-guanine transglycosylase [Chthonomonadaceae bacterium]|nr:tRNA-guanine transglycosylase [Chthonomonadaceae bacterium]
MSTEPTLNLHGAELTFPLFLPDATLGVVRSLDSLDLETVKIEAVVMNVFHLMQKPGSSTIAALGGLHQMSAWDHPIITDSGGFQAYSLIRQNPKAGRISDAGIRFQPEGAERDFLLDPEKSVQLQMAYGTDVVICLDDCTHVDDAPEVQELSVERTIKWAKRCKAEYNQQLENLAKKNKKKEPSPRPQIFGVVQGGGDPVLRERCADALLEIGFDGYGYGGYPIDAQGNLLTEMLQCVRECIPSEFPLHALGVGHPRSIVTGTQLGYQIFDCALPTRDARNGRLYVWNTDPEDPDFSTPKWFDTLYIGDDKQIKNQKPISEYCDCPTCQRYAVGYLRHLFKVGEMSYFRLATLHNLRFLTRLTESLRRGV